MCVLSEHDLSSILFDSLVVINPLNAELNPIRHLLALVGARRIVHVSRIRVKILGDSNIVMLI